MALRSLDVKPVSLSEGNKPDLVFVALCVANPNTVLFRRVKQPEGLVVTQVADSYKSIGVRDHLLVISPAIRYTRSTVPKKLRKAMRDGLISNPLIELKI